MSKLYKLTDASGQTYHGTQWGPGVTHTATGPANRELCTDSWIHAYEHPYIAVLLNPIHGNYSNPRLWLASGKIGKRDHGLKCGCRSLTTIKELALPVFTPVQITAFGILCALRVYKDKSFTKWANDWLKGIDRSESSARSAAWSAAWSAARSAWSAAESAASAESLVKLATKALNVK